MLELFFFTSILALIIAFYKVEDNPIIISKHTKYLNIDMVCSILQSIKHFEEVYQNNIQFLLNSSVVTKEDIENYADNLLFQLGEFPADTLKIDNRDFARLVTLHMDLLQGASDSEIRSFIKTIY
jgi:hypothetical protein